MRAKDVESAARLLREPEAVASSDSPYWSSGENQAHDQTSEESGRKNLEQICYLREKTSLSRRITGR